MPVIVPRTAFPARLSRLRWSVIAIVLALINVIDTEQRTGKGGNLTEADQEGLMDLALWGHECPTEQEYQSAY